ncbi:MAG: hemerythrin domain-containing protein [Paramuribaculum sp.]|nr:hemerythrin domain-containing protein [Paramuribaculum sp.]MDE7471029.1 hemerythrin domain-containing protein [Paramuribaculum sp.]
MNRSFFSANDSLVDLINRDFNILPILSRFSIPLGFGTKSIGEVCQEAGINTELFLLIVNFILTGKVYGIKTEHAEGLVDFLHKSHDYFMAFKFPHIRANLLNALDRHHNDINPAIVRFFDDYVKQVKDHFDYEETTVFPYVRSLAEGVAIPGYSISQFTRHHDKISEKLDELKNIILRYYTTSVPDLMYDVLVDLYNCQSDLENHNDIENTILVPVTTTLEMNDAKTKS